LARSGVLTASQHFLLGLALMELEQFTAAAREMRSCLAKRTTPACTPVNPDILTVIPRHSIAICLWQAKDAVGADEAFKAAVAEGPTAAKLHVDYARFLHDQGKTADALQLLNDFTSAHPDAAIVWIAGGEIALSQPGLLEVAGDWTGVALNLHPFDATLAAQRAEALLLAGQLEPALALWATLGEATNHRAHAARILCETALGMATTAPAVPPGTAVAQEFVRWYWRLVDFGAEPTVLQLHAEVDRLEKRLPEAARLVQSVIAKLAVA